MKLAICGPGNSGKDEVVCKWLKENTILQYTKSTSAYVKTEMFQHMLSLGAKYQDEEECYIDRINHRDSWASYIDQYNQDDPARLYKVCLSEQDILSGVRRAKEIQAVFDLNVIDIAIWLDRDGIDPDPTQGYGKELCDVILYNDTIERTQRRLHNLARSWGILKKDIHQDVRR